MSLCMKGIEKSFDANRVLKGVTISIEKGEIRALIGENGAGKSTLMNILGGVIRQDAGEILLNDKPVSFSVPRDSMDAGIAFIHQELNLVTDLSIYENLFIGREKKHGLFIDRKYMIEESEKVLARMNVALDPRTIVRELDASYKQIIEIARALLMNATVIIMDEPTTSLTEVEIERVFNMMRTLKEQGVSIIFISHKLPEVLTICDTFSVLRDGVLVRTGSVSEATEASLARDMIGHDVRTEKLSRSMNVTDEILKVTDLSSGRAFKNISFTLRKGEILGFTGLLGDGRSELFRAIFGADPGYTGTIEIRGVKKRMRTTRAACKAGLGYVPRDRKENGILKDLTILENASIVTYEKLTRLLLIDHKKERRQMDAQIKNLAIKLESPDNLITSLSGGNQQKVVLAKWLNANPDILIFDNPTQGVDVGAKEEIYDIILRLAEAGKAICILSSEAQEVIRLSDRVLVMFHGEIRGELTGDSLNDHNIMLLATGGTLAPTNNREDTKQ